MSIVDRTPTQTGVFYESLQALRWYREQVAAGFNPHVDCRDTDEFRCFGGRDTLEPIGEVEEPEQRSGGQRAYSLESQHAATSWR